MPPESSPKHIRELITEDGIPVVDCSDLFKIENGMVVRVNTWCIYYQYPNSFCLHSVLMSQGVTTHSGLTAYSTHRAAMLGLAKWKREQAQVLVNQAKAIEESRSEP